MDQHTLDCLDFARVREILGGFALSSLGRGLAAGIRPMKRPELIRRWLRQVEELERVHEARGVPPFGGISDIRDIVRDCAPPLRVNAEQLAQVGLALAGAHEVARWMAALPADCAELRHVGERIGDFITVANRIRTVIDERGMVRDDASPALRRIRRSIDECAEQTRTVVEKLLDEPGVRRCLQYANHTFHGDRMVLPVRTEYRGRVPGIVHRSSDSGATIYVEPAAAVELNNQVTNLRVQEAEEVNRILWEVAHEVYVNAEAILHTLDALAVLDLVVAKFRMARQFEMFCPQIVDEPRLAVRNARHPLLLELVRRRRAAGEAADEVVPISFRLGEDFDMLVITGPNTGGKTVALKCVGLLTLMAQSGLPIPAAPNSTVGVFGEVLIDIGDEQSMQQSLSTFSAHLTRQLDMLRHCGPRTLILIDELGAGTDPDEGAAIGKSVLDEVLRLGGKAVVTTHLGALKGFALSRPRVENGSVEFDVQSLRPTYHLRIGEAGQSCAIDIAQRLGMPRRLVLSARRNLSRRAQAMRAVLANAAEHKREAEAARAAADEARLAAQRALGEADRSRSEHESKKAEFERWLQKVVHLRPGDAVRIRGFDREGRIVRMRLDQQRAEVNVGAYAIEVPISEILPPDAPAPPPAPPRAPRQRAPRPANLRHPDEGNAPRSADGQQRGGQPGRAPPPRAPDALNPQQLAALGPGDRVFARRFDREGTIVRVTPGKGTATVTLGLLEVELPLEGLAAARPPRPSAPRKRREREGGAAGAAGEASAAGVSPPPSIESRDGPNAAPPGGASI
ncbi:MAG: DNA strand exchange inhibitor protein [Planctomycetia bacterium]|nr:MAG: DNA strand exchange inhibitor protein [Planctomycetia bacterium]